MKPIASLSLDLDNQWSYMKTHGDAGWETYPSYLDVVVPRFLELLRERHTRITVFVVGQDAALPENHDALKQVVDVGHEIGNHSFRHEPWLHRYDESELDTELARTEDALGALTGETTTGFRGPGYSLSTTTLQVLLRRGYRYDASTLPTYIGPLARAFYFRAAKLDSAQREEREYLFGTFRDGRRPVGPYWWDVDGSRLLELPVTTFPGVKIPIHVSYLLYLDAISPVLARSYFATALNVCRAAGVGPSILLHPLDFVSGDDIKELAFFPAMSVPAERKLAAVGRAIDQLLDRFEVCPVGEHAAALRAGNERLRVREPRFVA